jgi:hypothetical protein
VFGEFGFLAQNLGPGHVVIIVVERKLAAQKCVENDTQAPNINLFARIFLSFEHLWRWVTNGPAESLQMVGSALVFSCEPKIDQLDIFVLVEENVLQLEIAVDAWLVVNVADRTDKLCKYLLDFVDREGTVFEKMVVEFIARTILEDHPDHVLRHNDLI